jgi:MFS family permease
MNTRLKKKLTPHLKWFIWILATLFYFYEFTLKISPSVMIPELMRSFGINASLMGILSALYLLAYAPMQLPVGILIDRYGLKLLLSLGSLVCGIGAICFSFANAIALAGFGRILIGMGSSFAFISMVYICSHWFPRKRRALLIGIANSISMLGASSGGGPLGAAIQTYGWRSTIAVIGLFGIALAILIYWVLSLDSRDSAVELETKKKNDSILSSLKIVSSNGKSWINSIVAVCFYMTTTGLAALWGVPFVQQAYGVSAITAGFSMSMVFIGWLVGGPIMGFISDRISSRTLVLRSAMTLTLVCLCLVLYVTWIPIFVLFVCTFLIGFFSSAELLSFTLAIEMNPPRVKATAAAFTNFIVSMGDLLVLPFIGFILDAVWKGAMADSIRVYSVAEYQKALLCLPIALVVGILISAFLKDEKSEDLVNID